MKFFIDTPYFALCWIPTKFYYNISNDDVESPSFNLRIGKFVWNKQKGWRDIRKMAITS